MVRIIENALVVYTDGSCHPKGRKGGFGALFLHYDEVGNETELDTYMALSLKGTTSQRMELEAVATALEMAPKMDCYGEVQQVVICTDSQYIVSHHLSALTHWRNNEWCNRDGKPVDNIDLWRKFVRAYEKIRKRVLIEKVKGHGKGKEEDPHNVKADKLAKESRESALTRSEHRSNVRRKRSQYRTEKGSIRMDGQEIDIRVIEEVPLDRQAVTKFRCEVVSVDSPCHEAVDWLYSSEPLRRGHTYSVRLNKDPKYPQILEMISEIDESTDGAETSDEDSQSRVSKGQES